MNLTLIAAVDYNQSILAFIGFLVLLTPQVLAYLAGRRAALDNESTNRIVKDLAPVMKELAPAVERVERETNGAKTAMIKKMDTLEGTVLKLTEEKATSDEKLRAQEIKTAVSEATKETKS